MRNILIVYAKSTSEILNRKSAIGSYIHTLATLLKNDQCRIYINGILIDDLEVIKSENAETASPAPSWKKYIPSFFKSLLRERAMIRQAENLASRILRSDIIYHHIIEFYTLGSGVGHAICAQQKCPLTVIYDNPILEEYTYFQRKPVLAKKITGQETATIHAASTVITYSKPVEEYLAKKYPHARAHYFIHQNIDFSRFTFADASPKPEQVINLCFVGSFLKWHDTDMLVCEFDKLCKELPAVPLELYMVGDGMMRQTCEALSRTLNNQHIHFTGFLDGVELFKLQKEMHIGIMPGSNWYGAPNKLFEYGAMKMAVVAPDTPTIRYLFKEDEVVFFQLGNPESFRAALKSVITGKEKRLTFSARLHALIRNSYSPEKTRHFYRQILDM